MEVFKVFYNLLVSHYRKSRQDPDLENNEILMLILAAAILSLTILK